MLWKGTLVPMKPGLLVRILALALAAALALTGCSSPEAPALPQEEVKPLANDGRTATVVLGEVLESRERTDVLLEIAEKYQADYPNTTVEIATFASSRELKNALASGRVQIADIPGEDLPGYVREGLLADLEEDLPRWSEYATLLTPVKFAVHPLDSLHSYLIPSDLYQDVLFYRQDWMDAYNEGKAGGDMVYCRVWEQLITAAEKLGDRGKLVFAGQDRLPDYFDSMLWSMLAIGRLLDPGFGYYYPMQEGKGVTTVFRHEKAQDGMDQFARVMKAAVLPEALTDTRDQAVQAFIEGRAGFLLADRSVLPAVAAALPEGSWATREYPLGLAGIGVQSPVSYRGWGIAADAPDKDIVLHFLTTLSNADNNTHYAMTCGTYPLHSTALLLEPDLITGDFSADVAMARKPNLYKYAQEPTLYEAWNDYRAQAGEKLTAFARGELSQEALTDWLDEFWLAAAQQEGALWE